MTSISGEICRNWSARVDEDSGAEDVDRALDPVYVTERTHTLVYQLSKILDRIGVPVFHLNSDWDRFHAVKITKGQTVNRIMYFWRSHVPMKSYSGFTGRDFKFKTDERAANFREIWNGAMLKELELSEIRGLFEFVQEEPVSPSGDMVKRLLLELRNRVEPPPGSMRSRPVFLCVASALVAEPGADVVIGVLRH